MKKLIYLFLALLIVSCSSDDNNCDDTLAVGQSYQGGIIAYIDSTCQHGLIAATEDQSEGLKWFNYPITYPFETGASGAGIGTGLTNTNAIIAAQGSGTYAASIARDYNGGGYTDWFLPSKDELNTLYVNRAAIGGFTDYSYWSSTESVTGDTREYVIAWTQYFNDGDKVLTNKAGTSPVRAVRAF